jgi:hypothetical protein
MDLRERIVAKLTSEEGALRRAGIELVWQHALAQPVSELLDPDVITEILARAVVRENGARLLERHVLPGLTRVRDAVAKGEERVGDALPDDVKETLARLIGSPKGPRLGWLRGALDRERLHALIAPAIQEVFLSFVGRITQGGKEGGGGGTTAAAAQLLGRLGRDTGERLRSLGKSVAGGLGVDIEAKLRDAARDYTHAAVSVFDDAIRRRLATEEGQAIIGELARGVFVHVLETPATTIVDDLDRLPLADALGVVPAVLEHDLARALWHGIVREEARAALALEGSRTVRELLDEAKLLDPLHAELVRRADPVVRGLFASASFADWLDTLLAHP